ncbi:MAG: HesA/MoeB/ThiF family protein [Pseudoflavonifractor sp.]|nr:HesA/MoeB/ThiF family protein [Alloprevotella sp.]MCM1116684.1 HesA/MoeB/ThiF family protein [Pseudoflavonifractor sp.]
MDTNNRYLGHLNLCEIDLPGQQAIRSARVLIIGAGGLGSPVALYLAAAGVGTIGLADNDTVSLSNLQRQIIHGTPDLGANKIESARRAMVRINPEVEVILHPTLVTPTNANDLISQYDFIADCTDRFASRLLISDTCHALGKTMAHAAVARFSGQAFTQTSTSKTFRDIFGYTEEERTDCGCALNGILNTVVGIAGTIQATEIVKAIVGTGDLLVNRLLIFDALTMTFTTLSLN